MGSRLNETMFKEAGKEKSVSDSDMDLIQILFLTWLFIFRKIFSGASFYIEVSP